MTIQKKVESPQIRLVRCMSARWRAEPWEKLGAAVVRLVIKANSCRIVWKLTHPTHKFLWSETVHFESAKESEQLSCSMFISLQLALPCQFNAESETMVSKLLHNLSTGPSIGCYQHHWHGDHRCRGDLRIEKNNELFHDECFESFRKGAMVKIYFEKQSIGFAPVCCRFCAQSIGLYWINCHHLLLLRPPLISLQVHLCHML